LAIGHFHSPFAIWPIPIAGVWMVDEGASGQWSMVNGQWLNGNGKWLNGKWLHGK
jgi:hypothetical protein